MSEPRKYVINDEYVRKHNIRSYSDLRKTLPEGIRITMHKDLYKRLLDEDKNVEEVEYDPNRIQERNKDFVKNLKKKEAPIDTSAITRWEKANSDFLMNPIADKVKTPDPVKPKTPIDDYSDKVNEAKAYEASMKNRSKLMTESGYNRAVKAEEGKTTKETSDLEDLWNFTKNTIAQIVNSTVAGTATAANLVAPSYTEEGWRDKLGMLKKIGDDVLDIVDSGAVLFSMADPWSRLKNPAYAKLNFANGFEDIANNIGQTYNYLKGQPGLDDVIPMSKRNEDGAYNVMNRVRNTPVVKDIMDWGEDLQTVYKAEEGYAEAGLYDKLTKYGGHTLMEMGPQLVSMSLGMAASSAITKSIGGAFGKGFGGLAAGTKNMTTVLRGLPAMDKAAKAAQLTKFQEIGQVMGKRVGYYDGMASNALYEAGMEADESYNSAVMDAFTAGYKKRLDAGMTEEGAEQEAITEATEKAEIVRDNVMGANLAMLTVSNMISGRVWGLNKGLTSKYSLPVRAEMTEQMVKPKWAKRVERGLEMGKEGLEESSQTGSSKYELSHMEDKHYRNMATGMTVGILKGVEGLLKQDTETWLSFIGGVAGSSVTQPIIRGASNVSVGAIDPRTDKRSLFFLRNKAWTDPAVLDKYGMSKNRIKDVFDSKAPFRYRNARMEVDGEAVENTTDDLYTELKRIRQYQKGVETGEFSRNHLVIHEKLGDLVYDAMSKGMPQDIIKKQVLEFVQAEQVDSLLFQDVFGGEAFKKDKVPFMAHVEQSIDNIMTSYGIMDNLMNAKGAAKGKRERWTAFQYISTRREINDLIKQLKAYQEQYQETGKEDKAVQLEKVRKHLKNLEGFEKEIADLIEKTTTAKTEADLKAKQQEELRIKSEQLGHRLFNHYIDTHGSPENILENEEVQAELDKEPDLKEGAYTHIQKLIQNHIAESQAGNRKIYENALNEHIGNKEEKPFIKVRETMEAQGIPADQVAAFERKYIEEMRSLDGESPKTLNDLLEAHKDPRRLHAHLHVVNQMLENTELEDNMPFRLSPEELRIASEEQAKGIVPLASSLPEIVKQYLTNGRISVSTSQDIVDVLLRTNILKQPQIVEAFGGLRVTPEGKPYRLNGFKPDPKQPVEQTLSPVLEVVTIDFEALNKPNEGTKENPTAYDFANRHWSASDWDATSMEEQVKGQMFLNTHQWQGDEILYAELDMTVPYNMKNIVKDLFNADGMLLHQNLNIHLIAYKRGDTVITAEQYDADPFGAERMVLGRLNYKTKDPTAADILAKEKAEGLKEELLNNFMGIMAKLTLPEGQVYATHKEAMEVYQRHLQGNGSRVFPRSGQVLQAQSVERKVFNLVEFKNMSELPALRTMNWFDPKTAKYSINLPGDMFIPDFSEQGGKAAVDRIPDGKKKGGLTSIGSRGIGEGDLLLWVSNGLSSPTFYPLKVFMPMVVDMPNDVMKDIDFILSQFIRKNPNTKVIRRSIHGTDLGVPAADGAPGVTNVLRRYITGTFSDEDMAIGSNMEKPKYPIITRTPKSLSITIPIKKVVNGVYAGYSEPATFTYPLMEDGDANDVKTMTNMLNKIKADIQLNRRRLHIDQKMTADTKFMNWLLNHKQGTLTVNAGYTLDENKKPQPTRLFRNTTLQAKLLPGKVEPVKGIGITLVEEEQVPPTPAEVKFFDDTRAVTAILNSFGEFTKSYQENLVKGVDAHIEALMQMGELRKENC